MFRFFGRLQLAYVGLFFAAIAFVAIYQAIYVWPIQRCQARGGWWSDKYHECGTPIPIWRFTGRLPSTPQSPGAAAPAPK
ncbi:MAG TPA: hypothetical protein VGL58_09735 [Caulobacteraceae bacterium]|jgi:hypothetical protein